MTTGIQIDPDTWQVKKDNEDQGEVHPCNDPMPERCMCKGACSCHWVMRPITTHTTEPVHIKNAMLNLCENWESVASEFRERAEKSKTTNGKPNPEVCRSIAVGLEQCARDVRKVMGERMTQPDTEPAGPPGHNPERVYCDPEYGHSYCGTCHGKVIRNENHWTHSTE